jgi:phospholipase/carboxylesterase
MTSSDSVSPDTAAPLLDCVELHTGSGAPAWTVLWLHGLGADGNDFVPIVHDLVRPDWPALRFVFPHAPVRPVTVFGGQRVRAWYDITDFGFGNRGDIDGVNAAVAQVEALIAREAARGIQASRLILAGFSQGGAITLATALRRTEPLAGLVALSTYLPAGDRAADAFVPGAERQPLFMAHGLADPVVPYIAGERSAAVLRGLGFAPEWHHYPIAHHVFPDEIRDLGAWFQARFKAASAAG